MYDFLFWVSVAVGVIGVAAIPFFLAATWEDWHD